MEDPNTVSEQDQPYSPLTREAQEAHGGSMAPGQADPAGHPLRKSPRAEIADEEGGGTDD